MTAPGAAWARQSVTTQRLLWTRYALQADLGDRWTLKQEAEERVYVAPWRQHQWLLRTQLERRMGASWTANAGLAFFRQSLPHDPKVADFQTFSEWRPHLEASYQQDLGKGWGLSHRYRVEWRWIEQADGAFHWSGLRWRYQLQAEWKAAEAWRFRAATEILLNSGKVAGLRLLDQHRFGGSVVRRLSEAWALELAYLHWWQPRASGIDFYRRHIFRLSVLHRLSVKRP